MSWNKPSSVPQPPPKKSAPSSLKRGLLAGLLVVALGALGLYLFSSGEATSSSLQKKDRGLIKEVTPAAAPKAKPEAVKKRVITPEEQRKLCPGDEGWDPAAHPFVLVPTNRREEVVEDKHPVVRNATEQILHWICSVQPGDAPALCPDLPAMELENLNRILDQPADYQYDESMDRLEAKRAIETARKELKDYVAKGGDPHEFFRYYHMQLMNMFHERSLAQQSVVNVIKEDPEIAREYVEKVNARLAEKGIKPVSLSPKMRKRLGMDEPAASAGAVK